MTQDFPIGSTVDGQFDITERLVGERWRGRFRGKNRQGSPVLVTIAGQQQQSSAELMGSLQVHGAGISRLCYIGPLVDQQSAARFDVMVEEEPQGRPIADVDPPLSGELGLAIAVQLAELISRAHKSDTIVGGWHTELVYVEDRDGRLALSGLAPRAELFTATAQTPNFGLPDLFSTVYDAPEVLVSGAKRSTASDVFAVSALAAEWLSGRYPFEGANYANRVLSISTGSRLPLAGNEGIRQLLDRGLAMDPDNRPSIDEWLEQARTARAT